MIPSTFDSNQAGDQRSGRTACGNLANPKRPDWRIAAQTSETAEMERGPAIR